MAETFLFSIAEKVLGKIASLALQEVCLAWGLESDLKKMEENLTTIKAVLLDAEQKQAKNHELGLWLGRLKHLCYDAEDVLDELEYEGLRRKVVKRYGSPKIKVRRFFSSSNPLAFRFKMGHKIKGVMERLDEFADLKSKFHLTELVDYQIVVRRQREITDSLLRTSNVIGRDADKNIIMKFLLDPNVSGSGTVSVIPIVGIGGMGKTTLAKMLYNDVRLDEYFDLKIWVCVSDEFEKKQIMVHMIKSLTHQNRGDLDPDQLQTLIYEKLNSKRFLLVLDDVWSDDRRKWVELMDLLEGGASGSKVVVTTRSTSVATTVGSVSAYNLNGLSHGDSLSLFKKWAFKEGEEECYPHLMEIGDAIVKKCSGLPLAVRTLGTLLYLNTDDRYWRFIRDNEIWKLEQKENDILPELRLSYEQMPSHLKPCFAICSIYPKDYSFNSVLLTQVWMAHGLLQSSNEHEDIEDVALQYMKALYSRSFFQEFEEYGDFLVFTMHDLVHDLALSVAQSECFVVNVRSKNISEGIRHLSISDGTVLGQEVPNSLQEANSLRTIIFPFEAQGSASESFVNTCISTCKYLRMFDLRGSSFELLPNSIGALKHLRDLNLCENHRIKRLPDSICKLHNLHSLSLGRCSALEELPKDIRNLVKLRFLEMTIKQKRLPEDGIGCLTSLRFLSIGDCTNLEYLPEEMKNLRSLRLLNIWSCDSLISLPRNLKYFAALETLMIKDCEQLNLMEEDDIQDIELSLRTLILGYLPKLLTLPQWLQKSSNTLHCLTIGGCENFSSLPDWLQNFSSLRKIEIEDCPEMLSLPEGMHCLIALKVLRIRECPALCERYKKGGEDWNKIAHVTEIDLDEDESEIDLDEDESEILSAD
ncbi:putative disease resistance protein RGA3 [Tripterygium wilfordii]|uniref:putative disease resistance protein RGA3 n=1 Tax=Tripterygium wilfordii TaxID=458696 RepID=UPI0018F839E2|nr:putative disease resistance protein RGA3 [Tripterygium wilfordii]